MIALKQLPAQRGRAALLNGLEGFLLAGQNGQPSPLLWPHCADNVRQFEHEAGPGGLEIFHHRFERLAHLGTNRRSDMSVNRGRGGTIVA